MVTLKDLAKKCGLSVSAVSKALKGSPDIGDTTKDLVQKAAKELGYTPNLYARTLKTNRSYNIGILFDDDTNNGFGHAFFSNILSTFRMDVEAENYDLTFIARGEGRTSYLAHARNRRLDGVLVACVNYNDPNVMALLMGEIPVVAIDYISDQFSCVYSDNIQGLYNLTSQCIKNGHRRIAFIHGKMTQITKQRIEGYSKALHDNGIDLKSHYLLEGEYYSIETTKKKVKELMLLPDSPTCIILPDDYCMFGAQSAAQELGLQIPIHVSFAGYDDIKIASYFSPPLTTVRQDAYLIGKTAAEILLHDIEHRTKSAHNIEIPTEVVFRASVRTI